MTPREGCHGKLRHPSLDMAQAALASTVANSTEHPTRRARLVPYLCKRCGYYHIGHSRNWERWKGPTSHA